MKALIYTTFLFVALSTVSAQEKLTRYFPAGQSNAQTLIEHYLKPMGEDISVLPNNGWYTTAKTHQQWGFDLSITANSVFVSTENSSFDFPSSQVSGLTYYGTTENFGTTKVPTAYGKESEHPEFFNATEDFDFRGPDGFEPGKEYIFEALPILTIQAGVGLFKNTDLRFRVTPKVKISTVEFGNWGIGLMHNVLQDFTGITESKFSLSVFVGYTVINGKIDLSESGYSGNGQEAKVTTQGFTGQVVASTQFKIISFYGALGFDSGKTDIDINGTYTVDSYIDLNGNPMPLSQPFTLNNPFSFNYDNKGLRFTLGTRIKLGPITLNGDYSFVSDKRVLAAGIGFTVK